MKNLLLGPTEFGIFEELDSKSYFYNYLTTKIIVKENFQNANMKYAWYSGSYLQSRHSAGWDRTTRSSRQTNGSLWDWGLPGTWQVTSQLGLKGELISKKRLRPASKSSLFQASQGHTVRLSHTHKKNPTKCKRKWNNRKVNFIIYAY